MLFMLEGHKTNGDKPVKSERKWVSLLRILQYDLLAIAPAVLQER